VVLKTIGKDFNIVCVDISGNRELKTLMPLLLKYDRVVNPRLFIVKNFKLKCFV